MDQTYRKDMGEPRFDSNAVTRYQVNETSGNLYLYHQLANLPNQRGLPLNVYLTYNSRNFDAPHIFGKACWSLSLEKYLKVQEFYLVTDTHDWEEVEVGDLLDEEPDVDFSQIIGEISTNIAQANEDLKGLSQGKTELEETISGIKLAIQELEKSWNETTQLDEMEDNLADLDKELAEAGLEQQALEALEQQWEELWNDPNCDRDGWEPDSDNVPPPDYYMPEEDWALYQSLGGNSGFIFSDELYGIVDSINEMNKQRDDLIKAIGDFEDQRDDILIAIGELEYDLGIQEGEMVELDKSIEDLTDSIGEFEEAKEYYEDFQQLDYDRRHGATLVDGEGDGFFILEGYYEPASNPLHVKVEAGSEWGTHTVTFKDGRLSVFSSDFDGRILLSRDRYGNETTYYYTSAGSSASLSAVQDSAGRRVELTYDGDKVVAIAVKYQEQVREFSLDYDGENNLVGITNPENQTTYFQYYPPDTFQIPLRARPLKINHHLISKVIDARANTVNFEYNDPSFRCTRVWKQDTQDNVTRDAHYQYLHGLANGSSPSLLATDSRGYTHTKYITTLEARHEEGRVERKLITRIDDPFGKPTRYEYDEYYFHLVKTTDTNGLVHLMDYDSMGNLLRRVADFEGYYYETKYAYEPVYNQVTSVTDANQHAKYFYYVAAGEPEDHGPDGVLWREVDAEGNETLHWYNQYGQRIKTRDAREKFTEYEYDNPWGYLSRIKKYSDYPSQYYEKNFTYDCFGNKLYETDFNGNLTEYEYDVMNRLTAEKVHDGEDRFLTTYYYDAVGNRTDVVNPRNVVTHFEYDGFDRLIETTEALGRPEERSRRYGYDTEDNKTSEIDFNENETTFDHDGLNRLIERVEPLGKITRYFYEGEGDSSTNGGSHKYDRSKDRYTLMLRNNKSYRGEEAWLGTKYDYDSLYRLIKVTDPKNFETEYGYDPVGNKSWEEDANDHRTDFEYDAEDRLKKVIDPYSSYVEYWYDGMGNKDHERDKNDRYTYYEYDALNRLTRVTDAESGEAHFLHDGMNKIAERDKNGNWTAFSYNGRNLLIETHFAIPGIVSYLDYDEAGNKISETDPNGNVTRFEYDGLDRLTAKIQAYGVLNLVTGYDYDPNGNRTSIEDAEGNITYYEYDALNRLIEVKDPVNGQDRPTVYGYDLMGNKVITTDARTKKTEYFYDELNRLVKTENALNLAISYEYDGVGNRTAQVDAKDQRMEYEYDKLNRLAKRNFIGISEWVTYSYDATGNRIGMTDAIGTSTYAYDDVNRLLSVTTPGPSGSKTVGYSYYPNGERETMTDPGSGVTHYYYDELNRLERIVDPDEGETLYAYDAGSRLTQMTYPNGAVAHYDAYDEANRLIHLKSTDSRGTTTFTEFTYVYDRVGNRTEIVEPGGTTHYDYDDLYRLKYVEYPDSTWATYSYDEVGNRLQEIGNGVTKDYVYNDLNQLISWSSGGTGTPTKLITVTGTAWDDNLTSVSVNGIAAALNQQTFTAEDVRLSVGSNILTATALDEAGNRSQSQIEVFYEPSLDSLVEYKYDNNGCLERKTVDRGAVITYEYDFENRLVAVDDVAQGFSLAFTYDGDKRRVSKKDGDGKETWFLFDGLNVLQDLATDGTPWASYVQGIGIDKLISRKSGGNRIYYHCDAIGSVRSLTNEDEVQVGTYAYDAWGKVTVETGTTGNDYKFTSREWEDEIGLQFNRARFYDPDIGRFISPDPLTGGPDDPSICYKVNIYAAFRRAITEYIDGLQPHKLNRYVYCNNNPVNFTDPLGLQHPAIEALKQAGPYIAATIVAAAYAIGDEEVGEAVVDLIQKVDEAAQKAVNQASAGIEKGIEAAIEAFIHPSTGPTEYPDTKWTESADTGQEQTASSGAESGEIDKTPEIEEGAQVKVGEEGAQAEVDKEETTVESAGTREVIDIDEEGHIEIREEEIFTGTEEPPKWPVDDSPPPPPKHPVAKAIVDFISEWLNK